VLQKLEEEEKEKARLDLEEDRYWREYSQHRRNLILAENNSRSLECQHQYTCAQLEK